MPRYLQVREIRQELYFASLNNPASNNGGSESESRAASNAMLGRWFHEIFAGLASTEKGWSTAIDGADETEWETRLVRHAYIRWVGPLTARYQANLHGSSSEYLAFWAATRELCGWLAGLLSESKKKSAQLRVVAEQELSWEVREPGWSDSVVVNGVADAVFRRPVDGRWCIGELKLGKGSPEADLAQACLYHQMLSTQLFELPTRGTAGNTLALISFTPKCSERLFSSTELEPAAVHLKALIGKLAGVLPIQVAAASERMALPQTVEISKIAAPITIPEPVTASGAKALSGVPLPDHRYDELGRKLVKAFEEFNTQVKLTGKIVGPTFIRFTIEPGKGVKTSAIEKLDRDVQHRLVLAEAPFIHMDHGKLVVEVQRPDRQTILFSDIQSQLPPGNPLQGSSRVPAGINLEGKLTFADLASSEHAHILVAGTTGSGKSEWLRMALAGLITTNSPATLRLVLIDPKRNAFVELRNSPFLLDSKSLVFPGDQEPTEVLDKLIDEMDARYRLFEQEGADNLAGLNRKTGKSTPRIVCVCDEYADLISRSRAERKAIEERLCRLGSKARAAGIHLIIATQQPSREIIKGALDSNMPCRIGLKMSKSIESRMMNTAGAENLLGHGDLLFRDIGDPKRLQAPLVNAAERARIFGS